MVTKKQNKMLINKFQHTRNANVIDTIHISKYISYIRDGFDVDSILRARESGKGTKVYESIKMKRNAFTFNFLFDGYKKNSNITGSTGLLYYDIDDTNFTLDDVDEDKIYISHRSFGGNGYSLIVKASGVNKDNFTRVYDDISIQLGIDKILDKQARKMTQYTILSYDKNIKVNEDSIVMEEKGLFSVIKKRGVNKSKEPFFVNADDLFDITKEITPFFPEVGKCKLKLNTTLNHYDEDCVYIKEGKEYVECRLPFYKDGIRRVKIGERHTVLTTFINNLIYLNPDTTTEQIFIFIRNIVSHYFEGVIEDFKIREIILKKKEGVIEPYKMRLKKYWCNPDCKYKKKAYQDKRKSLSRNSIDEFFGDEILNLDVKITRKVIAEYTGLSLSTIKRRLTSEHKALIKEINKRAL